jgi:hypothetical protein
MMEKYIETAQLNRAQSKTGEYTGNVLAGFMSSGIRKVVEQTVPALSGIRKIAEQTVPVLSGIRKDICQIMVLINISTQ